MSSELAGSKSARPVKITVLAKRRAGVSAQEFSHHSARHATLAGPVMLKHGIISYTKQDCSQEDVAILKSFIGPQLAAHIKFLDADGITTMTFATFEGAAGFLTDEVHGQSLNADVAEFADVLSVEFAVGTELVAIQDGRLVV